MDPGNSLIEENTVVIADVHSLPTITGIIGNQLQG